MNGIGMINSTEVDDYIDQFGRILPLHRSFTSLERILIVLIVSTFVSLVGCTLFCLIFPRSPLRRRYYLKNKPINTAPRKSFLVVPPPPSYESIVKADEITDFNKLAKSPYLNIPRKSSNGTASDSDGIPSNNNNDYRSSLNGKSQSARSSFSNGGALSTISNTYPLAPYAQLNVELEIDLLKNLLNVHLINGEHFLNHPAFDDQAEYFIRIQLLNNKILKKFHDGWKKRRSSLSLDTWKKHQEKTTKNLSRTSNDTLICDEYIQFQLNKNDLTLTSIRFLLFCIDRSGIQDLMFETLIHLNPSMVPNYQQIIQFKNIPQIIFGELFLGISYLPTSERFTLNINKFRYFCKTETKIDIRFIVTFFHNNRRFFQKKIPFILHNSTSIDHEIKEILTQNIPQNDIQTVHVHVELNSKDDSFISSSSILLGEHTRYESDWQKMIEYPRQIHFGWYQFFG